MNFLCCGPGLAEQAGELSEMFKATQHKVVATSQATYQAISNGRPGQQQEQDWSNPFDYMRQERHSHEEISHWAKPQGDETTAHTFATHSVRRSSVGRYGGGDNSDYRDHRSNQDYRGHHDDRDTSSLGDEPDHRDRYVVQQRKPRRQSRHNITQTYNNRALALQEQIITTTEISNDSDFPRHMIVKKPLKGRALENQKVKDKHMMLNQKLNERALASREAAHRSKALREQALLVKHTESTRKGLKDVSAADVRDPETVTGMKCQVDVELEEVARKQAISMLNDDQYKFNKKAGIAAFSAREIAFNHRKSTTTLGPLV